MMEWVMNTNRWMSLSEAMLRRFIARCKEDHEHMSLLHGRVAEAARYPDSICIEMLKIMCDSVVESKIGEEQEGHWIDAAIPEEGPIDNLLQDMNKELREGRADTHNGMSNIYGNVRGRCKCET